MTDQKHEDMKKLTRAVDGVSTSLKYFTRELNGFAVEIGKLTEEFRKKDPRNFEGVTKKEYERRLREAETRSIYNTGRENADGTNSQP